MVWSDPFVCRSEFSDTTSSFENQKADLVRLLESKSYGSLRLLKILVLALLGSSFPSRFGSSPTGINLAPGR